ncbi:MAG: hypothetical protein AAF733_02500 [Verrucomicrobiota bacterium]
MIHHRFPHVPLSFLLFGAACTGCQEGESPDSQVVESEAAVSESAGSEVLEKQAPAEEGVAVDQLLRIRAKQQAEGLGSGGARVNGAWEYRGYSYLSPNPDAAIEARLVAVDLTISGHTRHFDLDDIEIVDGASLMSYGSDPHATALTLEGDVLPHGEEPELPPKASRWLLIYAFPKQSPAFHLYYWGRSLTREPIEFGKAGLELPYPPAGENAHPAP